MADEETKKLETETLTGRHSAPAPEPPKDVTEEKSVIPPPPAEHNPRESKALAIDEKAPEAEPAVEKNSEGSVNRDAVLARIEKKKKMSLITAYEESEKSKAENKAYKRLYAIGSWENSRKAAVAAELKKIEEQLEKKKAEYVEKMRNKIALIHKEAEEKRAMIEAKRGEDLLKAEELAAKFTATGSAPKKLIGFF